MGLPRGINAVTFSENGPKWERQHGKTAEQHGYLMEFLRLGRGRTVKDLQESTKRSAHYLYQLSRAHRWREVAEASDLHQDAMWAIQMVDEQRRAAREKLALSKHLTKLCAEAVTRLSGADVNPPALAGLLKTIILLQADVFDVPARVEVTGSGGGPVAVAIGGEDWDSLSTAQRGRRAAEIAEETARRAQALADYYAEVDGD